MEYQLPAAVFHGVEVIHAPLDDDPSRPLRQDEIETAINTGRRVARRLRAGRRVLSSCAMGLNRSAIVAAIAIHEVYGMSADEIIRLIRRARGPWALSNPNFERLLRTAIEVRRGQENRRASG